MTSTRLSEKDPLEVLLSSTIVTEETILSLVDEYSLYVYYLGYLPEVKTPYLSPIRGEGKGSWSLFYATKAGTCEFLWKDSGNGIVGNIFLLVRILHNLDGKQATFRQIDADFQLGLFPGNQSTVCKSQITTYEKPPQKGPSQIRVKSIPFSHQALAFWGSYGVTRELLTCFQVKEISHFCTQGEKGDWYSPKRLGFSYQIGDRYKIYQPFNKECKFLNNYQDWVVEGWLQLPPGKLDLLILTKSLKDCMTLRGLGYYAVAGRSESTPILPRQLELIQEKGKRVVTLFDQDVGKEQNWGQLHVQKYAHMGWENVVIPEELAWKGAKDVSDHYKLFGKEATHQLLNHLLHGS